MSKPRTTQKTVFTTFGKAVSDSFGLSFSLSADKQCDACRLWECCYASRLERRYGELREKLRKHYRNGPIWVVNRAIAQLPDKPIRWARLSVDGSLPRLGSMPAKRRRIFVDRLRELVAKATALGAKWHIPVESMNKARSYRAALRGLGVVVRRTSQARTLRELLQSRDHVSWAVAERIHNACVRKGETRRNTALAFAYAREIRSNGRSCVVCPAIASNAKCGSCTACADSRVDVVLYPFHA